MPPGTPTCALAIAGLDPTGGAGLLADARAMRAFGVHVLCVATAATAQDTRGVKRVEPISPAMLRAQIEVLLGDIDIKAVKIGMLPGVEHAQVIAEVLEPLRAPIVYDTVFAPSGGGAFLDAQAARRAMQVLAPRCELITPNLIEAQALCGFEIRSVEDVERAARSICERFGARQVLVKGGHALALGAGSCNDWLWNGSELIEFTAPRLDVPEARGTGCLLASAIAAQRARNVGMEDAIRASKRWLGQQIERAEAIGSGRRVIMD